MFPVGSLVLLEFVPRAQLRALGPYAYGGIGLFVKYFALAIVLYLAFRLAGLGKELKPEGPARLLFLIANTLVIAYGVAGVVASTVEGGGGSFAVAQFGPLVLWPSWLMIVAGLAMHFSSRKPAKKETPE